MAVLNQMDNKDFNSHGFCHSLNINLILLHVICESNIELFQKLSTFIDLNKIEYQYSIIVTVA